jgi:hypothetical protein
MNARSWRRVVRHVAIAWLVVIVAIATFETALHSVHHIDDEDVTACVVATAATQVSVAEPAPVISVPAPELVDVAAIDVGPSEVSTRPVDVEQGRAPPLPHSA